MYFTQLKHNNRVHRTKLLANINNVSNHDFCFLKTTKSQLFKILITIIPITTLQENTSVILNLERAAPVLLQTVRRQILLSLSFSLLNAMQKRERYVGPPCK